MKIAYEISNRSPNIKIYTEDGEAKGVYRLEPESAVGKTYLCKTLKAYSLVGCPVDGFDYYDYKHNMQISNFIGKGLKVVIIDRYDMYNKKMAEDIVKLSKECIVLIDCKMIPLIDSVYDFATVDFDKYGFIVKPGVR